MALAYIFFEKAGLGIFNPAFIGKKIRTNGHVRYRSAHI